MKKCYLTTPLYYVNAKPHLGTLYTTVLADVLARWKRLSGNRVLFLTGTDEHGQKIAESAAAAGQQPKQFVDELVPAFKQAWHEFEISYDRFIRTTDPEHTQAVQKWLLKLIEQGDIYLATYEGWYDPSQEAFLTEKDLHFPDPNQPPVSLLSGRPARWVSEESYFFRLSAYQEPLLQFYKDNPHFVTPPERLQEVITFVENGLKDLSISRRSITWGIPFPGNEHHVTYVWADALNGYISAIGWGDDSKKEFFESWWPADVQLMGKEILRFHAVYWPAFLMASQLPFPKKLLVHGWLTVDGQKMSKSLGNVIDPLTLTQKYGPEPVRYYLTRYLAVTQDGDFSFADLEHRINTDLANDLGNLLNRMLVFATKNGLQNIQQPHEWSPATQRLQQDAQALVTAFTAEMERCFFHQAYALVNRFVGQINSYFHEQEPWKRIKDAPHVCTEVIAATCCALGTAGLLLWPTMPQTMEKLFAALGITVTPGEQSAKLLAGQIWKTNFTLTIVPTLFTKYEPKPVEPAAPAVSTPAQSVTAVEQAQLASKALAKSEENERSNEITIDDLVKVTLVTGTITEVVDIPGSEKIYKMTVDCGDFGIRTICAGVKKFFTPTDLVGRKSVFVVNLKPRALLGITSQGMMLTSMNSAGLPIPVIIDPSVPNGTQLK